MLLILSSCGIRIRALVLLVLCLSGCGALRSRGAITPPGTDAVAMSARLVEAEALWENRGDPIQLAEAWERYRQLHELDPADPVVAARLIGATLQRFELGAEKLDPRLLTDAEEVGWRCLARGRSTGAGLPSVKRTRAEEARRAFDRSMLRVNDADVPCAYELSRVMSYQAHPAGTARWMRDYDTIRRLMEQVRLLEPSVDHYGPARFLASWYARQPFFAGQNLDLSRRLLDEIIEKEPGYLPNRVVLAQEWAVRKPDRALFHEQLSFVVSAPAGAFPDKEYEQEAAKAQARDLLAREDSLFPSRFILSPSLTPP